MSEQNAFDPDPSDEDGAPRVTQGRRRRVRRRVRKPLFSLPNLVVLVSVVLFGWFCLGVVAGFEALVVGAADRVAPSLPPAIATALWGFPIAQPVLFSIHRTWLWRGSARWAKRISIALLALWFPCAVLFLFVALF